MLKRTRVKAFGKGVEIKMEKGKIVEIMGPVVDVEFENGKLPMIKDALTVPVSYTHLRAHETRGHLVCRLVG